MKVRVDVEVDVEVLSFGLNRADESVKARTRRLSLSKPATRNPHPASPDKSHPTSQTNRYV